jgi:NAD+--asparagine ADP-ribosyltransferase
MANPKHFETAIDPITLWKLIHGGDPAPEVIRMTAAVAIFSLAAQLEGAAEIKAAATSYLQKQLGQAGSQSKAA